MEWRDGVMEAKKDWKETLNDRNIKLKRYFMKKT